MKNIVLARVDDRLIHGQVMTAWLQYTGGNHIVIVDDITASDEFTKEIMEMAVPEGIGLDIFSKSEAVEGISNLDRNKKIIILTKTPGVFLHLIESGITIEKIIIGGMGANNNRKKLYKNIATTEDEKEDIKKLIAKGIDVQIQVVPDEKAVGLEKIL
ncbi:PTS system mannose/fructose/N-acetylgalactosamine-transporter subunit IIB [Tetragenococcus koreensis]|uniref:PTS system mannose/fructose/N-acetylgalactosamine-transporter subunit IIB n=1 Tax=Tetragenococcus koreensis TaxID=290335 RepID=UPI001F2F34A8|nr:PTS sugar transporter subunit IIB [Tetragenococcus koreensis]MCF1632699.1 PTS sugar transporter subunit IIB [Tetragenococcus koreensis]